MIRTSTDPDVEIYQYITRETIDTIFVPMDEDVDINVPEGAVYVEGSEDDDKGLYKISQPNELGYIPVRPVYQSSKIYNGIGHTPIFDIAQIQRSIYSDYGEIRASRATPGKHRMPKALCLTGMVISILLFLLFLLDLVVPFIGLGGLAPFGQASLLLDLIFVLCAGGLGYLSWTSFRELD